MTSLHVSHPNYSEEHDTEDLLEKMLKEAEELALKMTRQSTETSVASTADGSDISEAVAIDSKFNVADEPVLSSDDDTELEKLLQQSEALLGKMRSKASLQQDTSHHDVEPTSLYVSVISPAENKVEPPTTSPKAPTSVYLVDVVGVSDDVSSVGSNSLRSPAISASIRMPSYSSSTAPIEEEPSLPATEPLPTIPSSNALGSTIIPDFTVTSPDAKWEKVESAEEGDDDYVPLVDYSKVKGSDIAKLSDNVDKLSHRSGVNMQFDENFDQSAANSVPTSSKSRVAAFRAQKKRLQKKRRRQFAALLVGLTLAGCYYIIIIRDSDGEAPTSFHDESEPKTVVDSGKNSLGWESILDSYDNNYVDEETEVYLEGLFSDEIIGEAEKIVQNFVKDVVLQDKISEGSMEEENEVHTFTNCREAQNATVVGEAEVVENVLEPEVSHSDLCLERKCKNPFQKAFNKSCRQIDSPPGISMEKRCKNILQRVLNKKCREMARQARKEKNGRNSSLGRNVDSTFAVI